MILGDFGHRAALVDELVVGRSWLDVGAVPNPEFARWSRRAAGRICLDRRTASAAGTPALRGDADRLPMPDAAVDTVSAVDVLEHMGERERGRAVRELVRVARRRVVVTFPFRSPDNVAFERGVVDRVRRAGETMPGLEDHQRHGLPDPDEIREMIADLGWHPTLRFSSPRRLIDAMVDDQLAAAPERRLGIASAACARLNLVRDVDRSTAYRAIVTAAPDGR